VEAEAGDRLHAWSSVSLCLLDYVTVRTTVNITRNNATAATFAAVVGPGTRNVIDE